MTLQNKLKLSVCSATLLATMYSVPAFSYGQADCQCGSIGNRVWFDADKDGIQDIIEPGVAGVSLTLTSCNASAPLTKTVTTDSNGYFWFYGLSAGSYKVTATSPANRVFTQAMQGNNSAKDSDVYSNGQTGCITLNANEVNNNIDIGLVDPNSALSQLGGTVFSDADEDGFQDSGESGVPNAIITLYDGWNNMIDSTSSDNNGYYSFSNLAPQSDQSALGCYRVAITLPDVGIHMNSTLTTPESHWVCTDNGEYNSGLNFGLNATVTPPPSTTASIGDTAFNDINGNGVQDNGEGGVAGVQLFLYNGTGTTYLGQNTQTDANGMFQFTGLNAGCYTVGAYKPISGEFSLATTTFTTSTWRTNLCVTQGQTLNTVDFGLRNPGTPPPTGNMSIGNSVFNDLNGNGVQDNGEPGYAGIRVVLFDSNGNFVNEITTGTDGHYTFSNLPQACYSIGVYSTSNVDFTGAGSWRPNICSTNLNIDFGVSDPTSPPPPVTNTINGSTWVDHNGDGVVDIGEGGIPNITVSIHNATTDALVSSQVTDANGNYSFSSLPDGCYTVKVTLPSGNQYSLSTPAEYTNLCVVNGQTITAGNFGLKEIKIGASINRCTIWPQAAYQVPGYSITVVEAGKEEANIYEVYKFYDNNMNFLYDTEGLSGVAPVWRNSWAGAQWLISVRAHTNPDIFGDMQIARYVIGENQDGTRSEPKVCNINLTPVALDLNGDGKIGVTGKSTARDVHRSELGKTVLFDMHGTGQKIEMEWFAGDGDGILIDNRDGLAARQMNGTRLFGQQDGQFAHGYEQLAQLDANRDGTLTGAELDGLALWVDDGDAVVQRGEIQNLVSYDIASISIQMNMINGLMRSTAMTSTGHTIMTEDVWFGIAPLPAAIAPAPQPLAHLINQPRVWLMSSMLLLSMLGFIAFRNNRKTGSNA